jgi:UDP:flavonoid glycosyltransferase YjiC (YdhE family)
VKALLAPLGSRGDIQPQLVLGEELLRRGHEVTLAAPPDFRAMANAYGLTFVPIGSPIGPLIRANAHMTERNPALALPGQLKLVQGYIEEQARDMLAMDHSSDIVLGAGLGLAGKIVADQRGVPHVFCHYSLSVLRSRHHPPAVMPVFGLPGWGNEILWRTTALLFDATLGRTVNRVRRAAGLPPHRQAWLEIHATDVIFAQDAVLGELPSDVPGNNLQVPALVPRAEAARPLSASLERFLQGSGDDPQGASPVFYLGFGSMPSVDRARIVRLAMELVEQHRARVVLFSSHGEDAGVELPPGIFACSDADHVTLFPRLDLLVHHGGAGTTAAALRSGVPQLIVPHIVDQFFHGRRIAELGAGPRPVPKAKLSAAVIAEALKSRHQYRTAAQAIRASLNGESGAKAAADHLERLARRGGA